MYHSQDEQIVSYTISITDAVLAFIGCIIFGFILYPSLKEYSLILLQSLPKNIDVKLLKKSFLKQFSGSVLSIHDLHIWSHTSTEIIATCHVSLPLEMKSSYVKLVNEMEIFFAKQGITSSTIQPEFHSTNKLVNKSTSTNVNDQSTTTAETNISTNNSYSCLYSCSIDSNCAEFKCCKNDDEIENVINCEEVKY